MPLSPEDPRCRLRLLYEVTSLHAGSLDTRLDAALELVTQALGLEVGTLSRIVDGTYIVERVYAPNCTLQLGHQAPLSSTYSSLTVQTGGVLSIDQMGLSPHAQHPLYLNFGFEAYLSAVVRVGGALYGTLSFAGALRAVPFVRADEELVLLLARWVGVIVEAQTVERQRREDEARFHSAFHDAAIGMAIVAPNGQFLEVNASLCEMLGYTASALLELGFQQLTHPHDLDVDLHNFQRVLSGQQHTYQLEKRFLHWAGHAVWGHLSVSAVRHDDGRVRYLIGQVQDVTERKHHEAQVVRLAYYDDLTGIHNRRYFFEQAPKHLALARREAWPVTFMYLDLNGFKEINDRIGHQAGDALLKQVAGCFREVLRASDLLARVGGDEFAVLLSNVAAAEAEATAERLAGCLKRPFRVAAVTLEVGVSIGVLVATDAASIDELAQQADAAMYRAKRRKHNEPYAAEIVTLSTALDADRT